MPPSGTRASAAHAAPTNDVAEKVMSGAERLVGGLENLFGRAAVVGKKAGEAAGRVGDTMTRAGGKLAALSPGEARKVSIVEAIEDGRNVVVVSRGSDRCVCESRAFADEIARLLGGGK